MPDTAMVPLAEVSQRYVQMVSQKHSMFAENPANGLSRQAEDG